MVFFLGGGYFCLLLFFCFFVVVCLFVFKCFMRPNDANCDNQLTFKK